ncbi:uncharacterized protein LOC111310869 [Durio zibethinus]|uniref:Uncharacterized protein LOC111310869 n=1 Tax=Durio zibethinus TaxID=66656 RepID=A0A6P6AME1_DURZI|nr:uncharacterized protein LOC111310869 [Durio zibethinus]
MFCKFVLGFSMGEVKTQKFKVGRVHEENYGEMVKKPQRINMLIRKWVLEGEMAKKPRRVNVVITKWVSDLDWRILFLVIFPISFIFFIFSLRSFIFNRTNFSDFIISYSVGPPNRTHLAKADQLHQSRGALCLVGGARRFELTGPSIVEKVLKEYPNADLFLHSPMDKNAFKLSLLRTAPRLASVRIFDRKLVPQTKEQVRVLTAVNSPKGIQGLLQYFYLVEGCLTIIESHQKQHNFTYDWIVRTIVDGYWNAPLHPRNFVAGKYTVPSGSVYGGLNDRLGIGDFYTSKIALSRLSLIPKLYSAGYRQLNSESAFKAQLTTQKISYVENRLPFCVVTDRTYKFPPVHLGVPVAALSSPGPLSGAKCRPCIPVCKNRCVGHVMSSLDKRWSWTNWGKGSIELCNARGERKNGWENIFDGVAGEKLAAERRRVQVLKFEECVSDFGEMKKKAVKWEAPAAEEICRIGIGMTQR